MSRRALALIVSVLAASLIAAPVAAEEPPLETAPPAAGAERVVVALSESLDAPTADAAVAAEHGLELVEPAQTTADQTIVVSTEGQPVAEVIAELEADADVAYAEPDFPVALAEEGVAGVEVDDPLADEQYALDRMHVHAAWSLTTGGSGTVAVVDTGVEFGHPDLAGRVLAGRDFVNDDDDAADDNGHGTWVAGIIAARANDGQGIAGVSWSDRILPVKVMNSSGTGFTSWLADGIRWAADNGATVINLSVGGFPHSQAVADAVDYAWSRGAVLVGAAGNNRRSESFLPASYPNVISVTATQADDEFTNWSSYGPAVDVSAPGGSIRTTNCAKERIATCRFGGDYITISGTSFATPNVAGVVALIRARFPTWTPSQVVSQLYATVDDLGRAGWDERYGRGRVNAARAVGGTAPLVAPSSGDGLEANDTMASARLLTLGSVTRPTIHPAGDVDWLAVDVPRAGHLEVRVSPVVDTTRPVMSSLPIDPIVDLHASDGRLLVSVDAPAAADDDVAMLDLSGASRIFIRVVNWYPNGNTAPYTVVATYTDDLPPDAVARTPLPGATQVARRVEVGITFSEPVTGVGPGSIVLRDPDGAEVLATLSQDASRRGVSLRPSGILAPNQAYAVEVGAAVRDDGGNPPSGANWTFTTGAHVFADSAASPFAADIDWLAEQGITKGCGNDQFCPTHVVTREQMASFLVRALGLPPASRDWFTDDAGSGHEADINSLATAGITLGCGGGRYCPAASVTRAQMASFLVRALRLPPSGIDRFTDDSGSSHHADINALAAAGITNGCGGGRYCPEQPVTREQMAAFLHRALTP